MSRVEIKVIFSLLFFCVACRADDVSPEDVFDLLSRRIDDVIHETRSIKSELAETKLAVSKIENKIENIEEKFSKLAINTDLEERIESNRVQEIMKIKDIAKSEVHEKLSRQKVVVQKMLSIEKALLRDKIEQFDEKYSTFEADIKSKLTQMNEMKEAIDETSNSLKKEISDVTETFSNTNSRLQNSISDVSNRMNNAESRLSSAERTDRQLSSKLNTIERNQNTTDSNLDSRISQLSSKVSELGAEAKKNKKQVAFSGSISSRISRYQGHVIDFDRVVTNIGYAYSTYTGIFRCPVAGLYLFTLSIVGDKSGYLALEILQNTKQIARPHTGTGENGHESGSDSAVVHAMAGDKITVKGVKGGTSTYVDHMTRFSGVLLKAD